MPLLMPKKMDEKMIRDVIAANNGKGIAIKGIPIEEYHAGPGISSSDIKKLINGTIAQWLHDKANPEPPTHALWLGNAIHCAVLEPEEFWNRYCREKDTPIAPARNTKEGKDAFEEYVRTFYKDEYPKLSSDQWQSAWIKWKHPKWTKDPISEEDLKICEGIAKSVKAHPMISQMFAEGESEVTLYWVDKETGILCKARPDRLNLSFPCIPDLKSTLDASLDSFENDITVHDYHVSAWWYLWGAKECLEKDLQDFVYVPCEKKEPFLVTFYNADEGSLQVGEGLCRAGLAIYRRYLTEFQTKKDVWTGFSLDPKTASIRPWAFNRLSQIIHAHDLQGMGLEKFVGVV